MVQSKAAASRTVVPCPASFVEAVSWASEPLVPVYSVRALVLWGGQGQLLERLRKEAWLKRPEKQAIKRKTGNTSRLKQIPQNCLYSLAQFGHGSRDTQSTLELNASIGTSG